jgi:hypothetical protein
VAAPIQTLFPVLNERVGVEHPLPALVRASQDPFSRVRARAADVLEKPCSRKRENAALSTRSRVELETGSA